MNACDESKDVLRAADLPETLDLDRCPIGERKIVDNGIGSVVPAPGQSVHAEILTKTGSQELEITHNTDGTIDLGEVGDDTASNREAETAPVESQALSSSPSECRDRAFSNNGYRVVGGLKYYYNRSSTPSELSRKAATANINRGGRNIVTTRNRCRMGDRVSAGIGYGGNTRGGAQVSPTACKSNDGRSVVSFGRLQRGTLGITCTYTRVQRGYDRVIASDLKLNKSSVNWTTNPAARSCRGKFDLQSVVTHERGHTFGLGHVSEGNHGNLTMSVSSNGPCQASERTLGRGDVLGLARKY